MKKLASVAAALAVVPMLAFAAPVFADSPGSFSTGAGMYQVRNESQNQTTYKDSVSAACNETVKYTILLSNTANGAISNITVKTSLTTGNMTATGSNGSGTTTTSGTATVNLPNGASLEYVAGSTQLINYDNHNVIATLPDGITSQGTSIASLAGSTNEWVQYKAKVNCQTPPEKITVCELATKKIVTIEEGDFDSSKYSKDLNDCKVTPPPHKLQVCDLSTKKVVTIDENDFDSAKYSKDLNKCTVTPVTPPVTPPTVLPNTGAGNVIGLFTAVTAAGAVAYRIFARRLSRQ